MGDVVQFRKKTTSLTGLTQEYVEILALLQSELRLLGVPPPIVQSNEGGFIMMWLSDDDAVGLEAPKTVHGLWSIHHHMKNEPLNPCYELRFQYDGDYRAVANAIFEALSRKSGDTK